MRRHLGSWSFVATIPSGTWGAFCITTFDFTTKLIFHVHFCSTVWAKRIIQTALRFCPTMRALYNHHVMWPIIFCVNPTTMYHRGNICGGNNVNVWNVHSHNSARIIKVAAINLRFVNVFSHLLITKLTFHLNALNLLLHVRIQDICRQSNEIHGLRLLALRRDIHRNRPQTCTSKQYRETASCTDRCYRALIFSHNLSFHKISLSEEFQ